MSVNDVTFSAIPMAKYTVLHNDSQVPANVYRLEKKDLSLLDDLISTQGEINHDDIFAQACVEAKKIFNLDNVYNNLLKKTAVFVAVIKNKIVGIQVVNSPKLSPNGQLLYSSRKNASAKEMEVDWIALNPDYSHNTKHVGLVLIDQLFNMAKSDRFKKIYCRSVKNQIDENPLKFYTDLKFKQVDKQTLWDNSSYNKKICNEIDFPEDKYDKIIPLLINRGDFGNVAADIAKKLEKETLSSNSINLAHILASDA